MSTILSTNARSRGFTLLEVLIAVAVLAIGLIALAALQASLTRNSAEAKVRGRVAAMLTTRMDDLRNGGYGTLADGTTSLSSTTGDCDPATPDDTDWMDCTRVQAGLGSLTTSQTITTWSGTANFVVAAAGPDVPQFKRLTLLASWFTPDQDPNRDTPHQLSLASDVSSLALTSYVILPPDDLTVGGAGPIVRTTNPSTLGVIPIALSTTSVSAASNPSPELIGRNNNKQIVGTRFTVLNYTTPSDSAVVIQKRFENEVIKCSCRFGAGGNNLPVIYRTAQWPAVWSGQRYDVYKPSSSAAAPGQALGSGPTPGVDQSPLCQECCRDHHDSSTTGVARFDPERRDGSTAKYNLNGAGNLIQSNTTYVDACRVIRVDGFWRTASDMYSRQLGLLETGSVSNVAAKTGVPTANATAAYTSFVKNYLKQYDGTVATAPANAQSMFDATSGTNVPALVTIAAVSNSDYRYLHARGLYVDYLEDDARQNLVDVLADNGPEGKCPTGTSLEDCVLPNLPFTAINLTEIAKWVASNNNVLTVNSGNLLPNPSDPTQAPDPAQPSGSRTIGKAVGTSDNTASIRLSTSGVAVNGVLTGVNGVDPTDDSDVASDAQPFQVNGTTNSGATFDVRVSGAGANPFVWFTVSTDVDKQCLKPANSDYHCVTSNTVPLPQAGSVKVGNYGVETTASGTIPNGTCSGQSQAIAINDWPIFRNYVVTSASVGGANGTIQAPVNDGHASETTSIAFSIVPSGGLVLIGLTEQSGSPIFATVSSCTTKGNGKQINAIVWNRSWIP